MTIIDAHQHFWRLARGDYRFPRVGDPVLYRDFSPGDLEPLLRSSGVSHTIVVQATDTFAETQFLLELASTSSFIAGVVGWWDPRTPDGLVQIERLAQNDLLVGVRPMLQGLGDISFLTSPTSLTQLDAIAGRGLVFDALIDPSQLGTIGELCRLKPPLQVVIDHMAKPWRAPDRLANWIEDMRRLAQFQTCSVKVSGYPFAMSAGSTETVEELVSVLRATFGADRLLWGSDWPVAEREGGYSMVLDRMQSLFTGAERRSVFGENAAAIYGLHRHRGASPHE